MSRYAKDRTKDNHPRPVRRIELDEKRIGPRLLLAAALLAIGGLFIAYGITQCKAVNDGWNIIPADQNADTETAGEFTLLYELGAGEQDTVSENKALTIAYTDAIEHATQIFSSITAYEGVVNLHYLSGHPNEDLAVDGDLYAAFELLERYGNRDIFLAPIIDDYLSIFTASDDSQVGYFDPQANPDVRAYFDEVLAFVHDPVHIRLALLGGNRVRLEVSAEYLAFCEKEGITHLVDLGWMENAFVVDAVARELTAAGFTHGSLSSFDGFARKLDMRPGVAYQVDVLDREGNVAHLAASMVYPVETTALVSLRTYGLGSPYDALRYYETADGRRYFAYLDAADGLCRAALENLACASSSLGCAEMALMVAPVYIADELDAAALDALAVHGIWHVRCEDKVIICNGTATFTNLGEGYRVA
ncbi:MAG: hypothetical protein IJG53_08725 [Eggerthellaceae bacterium]|nr:hypothetical protein [Eggerthellaceae bacterium]